MSRRALRALARTSGSLAQASGVLTTGILWLLAALIFYDVIMRTLNVPTLWAAEVSIYAMIGMAFLGVGSTQRVDGHFRVTFVRDLCPYPVRVALDAFAIGLTFLLATLFTIGAIRVASFSYELEFKTSTLLQVPVWILQGLLVIGGVFLAIASLRDLALLFLDGAEHRDGTSEPPEAL